MFRKIWIELRSSLWFVPGVLVFVAIGLALGLVEIDLIFAAELGAKHWQPLLNTGAEGARGMLTAIASSMITVAGVAFSITIVTLSLASTQYTPRILRNFMRDRTNQFVLGIFVAVFTYCLVVLRTIRGGAEKDGAGFVPLLAVAFGMLLALLAVGCLIFFIHHVAASIQASSILQSITRETMNAIDALYPERLGEGKSLHRLQAPPRGTEWHPVPAQANGYLQHIDSESLLRFAHEHKAVLRIERNAGDFTADGAPLVSADCPLDNAAAAHLRSHFVIGDFRTVEQDAGFGIRQIVDIGLKALSPGVNDTSTAVSCLDYLSAILCRLAPLEIDSPFWEEKDDARVISVTPVFAEFVARSFDEIRLCAASNVTILLQMLRAIERVALATRDAQRRGTLLLHAGLVRDTAHHSVHADYDRARVDAALDHARETLRATFLELPRIANKTDVSGAIKTG